MEPFTGKVVNLGGIDVMKYKTEWTSSSFSESPSFDFKDRVKTVGPSNRFKSVLFIEKEGFTEILKDAGRTWFWIFWSGSQPAHAATQKSWTHGARRAPGSQSGRTPWTPVLPVSRRRES